MANEYVQRQITAFLGVGTGELLANQYDQSKNLWAVQDVYPSKVMKLTPGKYSSGTLSVASGGGTATVPLPGAYDNANRLAVFLAANNTVKAVTVSPAHATSTVMITAGAAQSGFYVFNERVTSITLTNAGSSTALVSFATWEYPADISAPSAWQGGVETIGTVSA